MALALAAVLALATPADAQHEQHEPAPDGGWAWSADATLFVTGNFQVRRFRDFNQVESQNWFMGSAARRLGTGSIGVHGMLSFEPFTLRELGSAQAFQTGETFGGAPLIDYQHPHDLVMGLAAHYRREFARVTLFIRGGLVDAPALGPTPFMHRASASLHPTAPLAHHQLDSTHITHGVITAGIGSGAWQIESSAFRGREPDENRTDFDLGTLDSIALRGSWMRGGTRMQVSVGLLADPHISEPGDVTRLTASVEHEGAVAGRAVAVTVAWGQNRGRFSTEDALLVEGVVPLWRGDGYVRGEVVDKHILEAGGLHPPALQHPHIISTVAALTIGYQHAVWSRGSNQVAIGADLTGHLVPDELVESYGGPLSTHVYGRWTFRAR